MELLLNLWWEGKTLNEVNVNGNYLDDETFELSMAIISTKEDIFLKLKETREEDMRKAYCTLCTV